MEERKEAVKEGGSRNRDDARKKRREKQDWKLTDGRRMQGAYWILCFVMGAPATGEVPSTGWIQTQRAEDVLDRAARVMESSVITLTIALARMVMNAIRINYDSCDNCKTSDWYSSLLPSSDPLVSVVLCCCEAKSVLV
jgi:hypothetical protein